MEKKRTQYLFGGLVLALVLLTLAWAFRPRSFADFSNMEQATDFSVYPINMGAEHEFREARPDREEIGPLLDLLAEASMRLDGRCWWITTDPSEGQVLYHFCLTHIERNHWALDAQFNLCSDGMLYTPLYIGDLSLGYARYQLSGCDMDAVCAEIQRLLGMA